MFAFSKALKKRFALIMSVLMIVFPIQSFAASFSDTEGHWASDYIETVKALHMISGYEDGRFLPDRVLSRAEFIAMILNASQMTLSTETDDYWATPYIQTAIDAGLITENEYGDNTRSTYDAPISREEMASILIHIYLPDQADRDAVDIQTAVTDLDTVSPEYAESVALALSLGFFTGFPDATFRPTESATRAQAAVIICKYLDYEDRLPDDPTTEDPTTDDPGDSLDSNFAVSGIEIGDSAETVSATLGSPNRVDASPYDFDWWIYHNQYEDYYMIGIGDDGVKALFVYSNTFESKLGLTLGMTKIRVSYILGSPVETISKSGIAYTQPNTDQMATYKNDSDYITAYFDSGDGGKLFALLIVDADSELEMNGIYGNQTDALRLAYEKEILDLTNVFRVSQGTYPLAYSDAIAVTARAHSEDMVERDFFSHTNPDGESPFERILADGIDYGYAAENIAAGYPNVFAVHAGWLASEGHRENLLREMTYMGAGVAFGGTYNVYYTQDFYAP